MYTSTILVGEAHLGTIEYPDEAGNLHVVSHSIAYFCFTCGDVWARLVSTGPSGKQGVFYPISLPCARHSDGWNLPGSLLGGMMEQILGDLPPDAVRREFNLLMQKYERKS